MAGSVVTVAAWRARAGSRDAGVRAVAAADLWCPGAVLRLLSTDPVPAVWANAIRNPRLPVPVMAGIIDDVLGGQPFGSALTVGEKSVFSRCVAEGGPVSAVVVLSSLRRYSMLFWLVGNPGIPKVLLNRVLSGVLLDAGWWGNMSGVVLSSGLRNPACPAVRLRWASKHADPVVRAAVAANPDLPVELAKEMSADLDPVVLRALAGNPIMAVVNAARALGQHP